MKEYNVVNGTSYDIRTPEAVIRVLEQTRINRSRIHVSLGDTDTGRDWLEENMVTGYIGRSTGSVKIPLIVHNARSMGGPGLLDHCIVRIRYASGGHVLYQHPSYHYGVMETRILQQPKIYYTTKDGRRTRHTLVCAVYRDGEEQAAFKSVTAARHYLHKLGVVAPLTVEDSILAIQSILK